MTTELTLREKVEQAISESENMVPFRNRYILDRIIAILDATGAPAYIRVADDLRGVVREELDHDKLEFWPAKEIEQ